MPENDEAIDEFTFDIEQFIQKSQDVSKHKISKDGTNTNQFVFAGDRRKKGTIQAAKPGVPESKDIYKPKG